jgi:hypothetical protein
MSTFRNARACVLGVSTSLLLSTAAVNAIQIGPPIKIDSHGHLSIGPVAAPVPLPLLVPTLAPVAGLPQVPLPGLPQMPKLPQLPSLPNIKIDLPALGRTIARPFEEIGKSFKDPFGYKKWAQEREDEAAQLAKNMQVWADGWMNTISKGTTFAFGLAIGLIFLLIRRRPPQQARTVAKSTAISRIKIVPDESGKGAYLVFE